MVILNSGTRDAVILSLFVAETTLANSGSVNIQNGSCLPIVTFPALMLSRITWKSSKLM
jgi:hypothetical protein